MPPTGGVAFSSWAWAKAVGRRANKSERNGDRADRNAGHYRAPVNMGRVCEKIGLPIELGKMSSRKRSRLADHAGAVTARPIDRDHGFNRDLPFVRHIDDAWLDRSGRPPGPRRSALGSRRGESELDGRNEMLEELIADLADVRIVIGQAVLQREAPVEGGGEYLARPTPLVLASSCCTSPVIAKGRRRFMLWAERQSPGRHRAPANTCSARRFASPSRSRPTRR